MPSPMMTMPAMNAKKPVQSCGNCKKGKTATNAPNAMMTVSRVIREKYTPEGLWFNDNDELAADGFALEQIFGNVAGCALQEFFVHLGKLARNPNSGNSRYR